MHTAHQTDAVCSAIKTAAYARPLAYVRDTEYPEKTHSPHPQRKKNKTQAYTHTHTLQHLWAPQPPLFGVKCYISSHRFELPTSKSGAEGLAPEGGGGPEWEAVALL